ncbi:hypothetical protein J7L13_03595 [bacterium]|nr:hypothetical protein [bacterium]
MRKRWLITLGLVLLAILPCFVLAQTTSTSTPTTPPPLPSIPVPDIGPSNLGEVASRILRILFAGAGLVALFFIALGGYRYITSGGNAEAMEEGKRQVLGAIIGLIIVICANAIINFIDDVIAGGRLTLVSHSTAGPSSSAPRTTSSGRTPSSGRPSTGESEETAPQPHRPAASDLERVRDEELRTKIMSCERGPCEEIWNCYQEAKGYYNRFCHRSLDEQGRQACQKLKRAFDLVEIGFFSPATIEGIRVNRCVAECVKDETTVDPDTTCNTFHSYLADLLSSEEVRRQPYRREREEPTERERRQEAYRECMKEAKTKYNECLEKINDVFCVAQKKVYEQCLRGLGYIFRSLCTKARRNYEECRYYWHRICREEYSRRAERCRLEYRYY